MSGPRTLAWAAAVLAELTAHLERVRVGGSAECGGPHEATLTVPAP